MLTCCSRKCIRHVVQLIKLQRFEPLRTAMMHWTWLSSSYWFAGNLEGQTSLAGKKRPFITKGWFLWGRLRKWFQDRFFVWYWPKLRYLINNGGWLCHIGHPGFTTMPAAKFASKIPWFMSYYSDILGFLKWIFFLMTRTVTSCWRSQTGFSPSSLQEDLRGAWFGSRTNRTMFCWTPVILKNWDTSFNHAVDVSVIVFLRSEPHHTLTRGSKDGSWWALWQNWRKMNMPGSQTVLRLPFNFLIPRSKSCLTSLPLRSTRCCNRRAKPAAVPGTSNIWGLRSATMVLWRWWGLVRRDSKTYELVPGLAKNFVHLTGDIYQRGPRNQVRQEWRSINSCRPSTMKQPKSYLMVWTQTSDLVKVWTKWTPREWIAARLSIFRTRQ